MKQESKYFKIEYDPRLVVTPEFANSYHICQFRGDETRREWIDEIGWMDAGRNVIVVQPGFDIDFDYLLALAQVFEGIIPENNPEIVRRILMGWIFVRSGATSGDIPVDQEVFVIEFEDDGKTVVEWRPIILAIVEDITDPILKEAHPDAQARLKAEAKAWMDSRPDTRSDYERGMDAITKSIYGFEITVPNPFEKNVSIDQWLSR